LSFVQVFITTAAASLAVGTSYSAARSGLIITLWPRITRDAPRDACSRNQGGRFALLADDANPARIKASP